MAISHFGQSSLCRHSLNVRGSVSFSSLPFDTSVATVNANTSSMTFLFLFHISLE
ncbi:hypothetical protein LguiA_026875 [Lonicera macranthoides]